MYVCQCICADGKVAVSLRHTPTPQKPMIIRFYVFLECTAMLGLDLLSRHVLNIIVIVFIRLLAPFPLPLRCPFFALVCLLLLAGRGFRLVPA